MAKKKKIINRVLPNHLAIYVRVSTEKQITQGFSMQDQYDRGIAKANELGWSYKVYDDSGVSGDVDWLDRPGIKELINLMDDGKIGGLFTVALDRLSRDGDYVEPQVLITKLKDSGIRVFQRNGEIDIKDESAELASRFQGLFASYERKLIQKRTSTGARNSMLSGRTAGGGQLYPYGFDKVNKTLVINEEQAKWVRQIFHWYTADNFGTQTIAGLLNAAGVKTKRNLLANGNMTIKRSVLNRKTGEREVVDVVKKGKDFVWRDAVVYAILTNTIYKGDKKWSGLTIKVPQIIDTDTYEMAQSIRTQKMRLKRAPYTNVGKVVNHFLLKGLIRCGTCGKSFYGHKRIDLRDKAYKCLSHRYKAEWCGNRGIDIDYLENLVWSNLLNFESEVIHTYEFMESSDGTKMYQSVKKKGEQIINDNNKHIMNLTRNFNEGKIKPAVYEQLLSEYEEVIGIQEKKIKDVEHDNFLMINKQKILDVVHTYTAGMKKAITFEDRQNYVRAFVDKIIIQSSDKPEALNYYHSVFIYYKLDQFTQFYMKTEIESIYKKNWHRLRTESKPLQILLYKEVKNGREDVDESLLLAGF